MAAEGAHIIAVDIAGKLPDCVPYDHATPEDLAETVRLVEATGRRIVTSVVDVGDAEGLRDAVDEGTVMAGAQKIIDGRKTLPRPRSRSIRG